MSHEQQPYHNYYFKVVVVVILMSILPHKSMLVDWFLGWFSLLIYKLNCRRIIKTFKDTTVEIFYLIKTLKKTPLKKTPRHQSENTEVTT